VLTNNDNDYTQLNAIPDYGSCNNEQQFSQELWWATPKGGAIEATVGGFLSRQQWQVDLRIRFGDQYYIWAANPSSTDFPTLNGKTWAQGAYADAVRARHAEPRLVPHQYRSPVRQCELASRQGASPVDRRGLRYTWEHRTEAYAAGSPPIWAISTRADQ
jgi:iron complex outermembrane receptor protein